MDTRESNVTQFGFAKEILLRREERFSVIETVARLKSEIEWKSAFLQLCGHDNKPILILKP